jgi:DNA replication and repair protein RecF
MFLKNLILQNFRNYSKSEFSFDKNTTIIVGPNASGKTNFLEAIFFLARSKSFKTDKDEQVMRFGEEVARLSGEIIPKSNTTNNKVNLEVIIASKEMGRGVSQKKFLVNGVSKKRIDFVGNLLVVLFSPLDLDMVIGSPSLRRNFLNSVLETTDMEYRRSLLEFTKALRQRNALLERARETGARDEKQFEYWDNILTKTGVIITQKREELINFFNSSQKDIFDFMIFYDKSVISKERLLQYKQAEFGAGVTLVGPHRDDFATHMFDNKTRGTHDVKFFGSRGQQRLVVLQLKLFEIEFVEKMKSSRPILLLDDIFSELDEEHIELVLEIIGKQQTFITTTHKELVKDSFLKDAGVIELER